MPGTEQQTTVGGLRAVEMQYRPVREIATGRTVFYQSRTQLNTPELGVLMPEAFRGPAEFSGQSRKLFPLELMQLAEAIQTLTESEHMLEWASVYLPLRVLKDGALAASLEKTCEQFDISPGKLCFALPPQILSEKDSAAANAVAHLRKRGFHMMLTGFGESGAPFMELADLPVDYVLLSPSVTGYLGRGERSDSAVHAVLTYINELGCEPIADGVRGSAQASALYSAGCSYCAGELSGGYVPLETITEGNS